MILEKLNRKVNPKKNVVFLPDIGSRQDFLSKIESLGDGGGVGVGGDGEREVRREDGESLGEWDC